MTATPRLRQQGAVAVVTAVLLGIALLIASLAVDLGFVFWTRRDLQRTVDLASLSAVTDLGNASATARRIAADNGFNPDVADNVLTVVPGIYDDANRSFAAGGNAAQQNAVQVTATTQVPYFFVIGSRSVTATATAEITPTAGFSLGSFVARLDAASSPLLNSLLGGLLGGAVNLDLVSYQGLAAASITLGELQTALRLGSVEQVLDANVSLADLLDATITALNDHGDAASLQAASILGMLRASVGAGSLRLGDLLQVGLGNPDAAAAAQLNILELVSMAAQVANGSGLIKTTPTLGIPGVASVNLAVTLVDPPAIAIGPAALDAGGKWVTHAHVGQVRVRLTLQLLGAVSGGVVTVPIYIEAGAADADLTGIQCRQPLDTSLVTIQTQPQLLAAYIGNVSDAAMQNHAAPVTVTSAPLVTVLGLVRIDGYASVPLESPAQTLVFDGPFDMNNTLTAAGASLGLGGLLNSSLQLTPVLLGLPLPLGGILGTLTGLLGAVLGPTLDSLLLDPILSLLGVRLGGGDVTAFILKCSPTAPRRLVQ